MITLLGNEVALVLSTSISILLKEHVNPVWFILRKLTKLVAFIYQVLACIGGGGVFPKRSSYDTDLSTKIKKHVFSATFRYMQTRPWLLKFSWETKSIRVVNSTTFHFQKFLTLNIQSVELTTKIISFFHENSKELRFVCSLTKEVGRPIKYITTSKCFSGASTIQS